MSQFIHSREDDRRERILLSLSVSARSTFHLTHLPVLLTRNVKGKTWQSRVLCPNVVRATTLSGRGRTKAARFRGTDPPDSDGQIPRPQRHVSGPRGATLESDGVKLDALHAHEVVVAHALVAVGIPEDGVLVPRRADDRQGLPGAGVLQDRVVHALVHPIVLLRDGDLLLLRRVVPREPV